MSDEIKIEIQETNSNGRAKKIVHALSSVAFLCCLIAFLVMGAVMDGGWATSWLWLIVGVFLSTLVEGIGNMFFKKNWLSNLNTCIILIALAIFLFLGITKGLWHPAWICFPIAAIIDGIISTLVNAFKK